MISSDFVFVARVIGRINEEIKRLQDHLENPIADDRADMVGMSYTRTVAKLAAYRDVLRIIDQTDEDLTKQGS